MTPPRKMGCVLHITLVPESQACNCHLRNSTGDILDTNAMTSEYTAHSLQMRKCEERVWRY